MEAVPGHLGAHGVGSLLRPGARQRVVRHGRRRQGHQDLGLGVGKAQTVPYRARVYGPWVGRLTQAALPFLVR